MELTVSYAEVHRESSYDTSLLNASLALSFIIVNS